MTGDVWAFLRHLVTDTLGHTRQREGLAFLEQAAEFFDAASNPRMGSKPLLYYYSFLNLAKMALVVRGVALPPGPRHGISDPRANVRTRLRLEGQTVHIEPLAAGHSATFPELVKMLGGDAARPRDLKVIGLMEQIPSIHRTFVRVTRKRASFLPIRRIDLVRDGIDLWAKLALSKDDKDVKDTLPTMRKRRAFRRVLHQVDPPDTVEDEMWYESDSAPGQRRGIDRAIRVVATRIRSIGVWTILTAEGYRCYFWNGEPRRTLPPLAAA